MLMTQVATWESLAASVTKPALLCTCALLRAAFHLGHSIQTESCRRAAFAIWCSSKLPEHVKAQKSSTFLRSFFLSTCWWPAMTEALACLALGCFKHCNYLTTAFKAAWPCLHCFTRPTVMFLLPHVGRCSVMEPLIFRCSWLLRMCEKDNRKLYFTNFIFPCGCPTCIFLL